MIRCGWENEKLKQAIVLRWEWHRASSVLMPKRIENLIQKLLNGSQLLFAFIAWTHKTHSHMNSRRTYTHTHNNSQFIVISKVDRQRQQTSSDLIVFCLSGDDVWCTNEFIFKWQTNQLCTCHSFRWSVSMCNLMQMRFIIPVQFGPRA